MNTNILVKLFFDNRTVTNAFPAEKFIKRVTRKTKLEYQQVRYSSSHELEHNFNFFGENITRKQKEDLFQIVDDVCDGINCVSAEVVITTREIFTIG